MAQKLTAARVKQVVKAGEKTCLIDGDGLRLNIDSAGRAYWQLRVMHLGKSYDRSLGRVWGDSGPSPEGYAKLAEARELARAARTKIKGGAVVSDHQLLRTTFAKAAGECHRLILPTMRNQKAGLQWITSLQTYCADIWNRPVSQITERDVLGCLTPIWMTMPETSSRILQRMKRVHTFARANGYAQSLLDWDVIRSALPSRKRTLRHMPSAEYDSLPALIRSIDASSAGPVVRAALRFCVATALRPGNVANCRIEWVQVIDGEPTLVIPGEHMKNGVQFRCPLNSVAVDALAQAKHYRGDSEFAFAMTGSKGYADKKGRPMSENTMRVALRKMGESEITVHGFRSSFREWTRAKEYPEHLAEQQLAHTDPNKVQRAYARADGLDLRRKMMKDYAKFLLG